MWNFNFARNICNQKLPYRDFNMLQPPLSAYISAVFLKIFGESLVVYRILGIVLLISISSLLYKICSNIAAEKWLAFIFSSIVEVLCLIVWIYNYNNLIVLLILIVFYLELIDEKSENTYILCGFIMGCTLVIKQSTGACLILANAIICGYDKICSHKSKRSVWLRFSVSMLPGIIFLFYLFCTNTQREFWDYAVVGVSKFTHRITLFELITDSTLCLLVGIFPFISIVLSCLRIVRRTSIVSRESHIHILIISILGGSVAYPLTDYSHMIVACIPYVVCLFCCIRYKVSKMDKVCGMVGIIVIATVIIGVLFPGKAYRTSSLNCFQGIPINKELENAIIEADAYIVQKKLEGVKVLIADDSAAAYMIPLGHYNKDFDMLLGGNLGSKTIEELLAQDEDTIFLVRRDERGMGIQNHFELIHVIKNTYTKIEEVQHFDAYVKKK